MSRWANLNADILSEIIQKIKEASDHIRCSSVCSSWRSVAKRHRHNLPHSIPGIMLSPRHSLFRNFIPLPHNSPPSKFIHHPHHDLDISPSDTCFGSYQGWLVQLINKSICLHNPFSKQHRLLPTLDKDDVYKAVLSSSPSFDMNCVVLILFETKGASFCRLGDDSWKNLECHEYYSGFSDALFFGGIFYVVDDYGSIYACNVDNMIMEQIEPQPSDISKLTRYKFYLVELQGNLYRVVRKFSLDEEFYYNCDIIYDADYDERVSFRVSTREFRVSRMDPMTNKWVPVYNLGGYAIFLGCSNSFSLSELQMGGVMKRNRIYFTDDRQMNTKHFGFDFPGRDMGIYDMMDMSIKPLFSDPFNEIMDCPPAVWVTPLPW